MRSILLALVAVVSALAQIPFNGQRIAGITEWPSGDGGPATEAYLEPGALAFDRDGSLLIADQAFHRIRRMSLSGTISTALDYNSYAIQAVIGMAVDSRGNLFLVDDHAPDPRRLVEVTPDGRMIVIASFPGFLPAIAVDASDNLYFTDQDAKIVWKRSALGVQQVAAKVTSPVSVAIDAQGNLLVADYQRIMRVNPDGSLTVLADGSAFFNYPTIRPAPDGSIYIGAGRVWRWSLAGGIAVVAGTGTNDNGFNDGCAASGGRRTALTAALSADDVAIDSGGRVYVADLWNSRVRRIDPDGSIRTVAGSGFPPRSSPQGLHSPGSLAVDAQGNVYFAEIGANRVRQITPSGQLLTIAGGDSPPPGEDAACYPYDPKADMLKLAYLSGIAVDSQGSVYISDTGHHRIRRCASDGTTTTIAADDLMTPGSIAADPAGNIYFADSNPAGTLLRRIGADGALDTVPAPTVIAFLAFRPNGELVLSGASGLFADVPGGAFLPFLTRGGAAVVTNASGAIYTLENGSIVRQTPNCSRSAVTGSPSSLFLAMDTQGNFLVSDPFGNSVWRIADAPVTAPDVPSPYLDDLGIRNAASNLTVTMYVTPTHCGPFCQPVPVTVKDSIAPGEILRITGGCLGPLQPAAAPLIDGRLPTAWQGTQVTIGGVAAPLLSVQSAEILAVVPGGAAPGSSLPLTVINQGVTATSTQLSVSAAVPGIFMAQGTEAAILNSDLTWNSASNPAAAGSVVSVFLTGTGLTDPIIPDGVPAFEPLPRIAQSVTVTIGKAAADVLYAGAVAGLVGVTQINFRVPALSPSSAVAIQVAVNGITLQQNATLAVR